MEMPGFWDKPTASAGLMQKRRQIERKVENLRSLRSDADEIATWQELLGNSGEADPDALAFVGGSSAKSASSTCSSSSPAPTTTRTP